jgi:hypothetical protein
MGLWTILINMSKMIKFATFALLNLLVVHAASLTVPYSDSSLTYTGRVTIGSKCALFDWSGVEIAWSVSGTDSVSLELNASNNTFNVFIDDKLNMILNGTETMESFTVAQLDASQPHNIKITKRTEAIFGPVCFASVTLEGPSPSIHPTTEKKTHLKIEYIGDSITCGYGILGKTVDCPFTRDTEDFYECESIFTSSRFFGVTFAVFERRWRISFIRRYINLTLQFLEHLDP